MLKWEEALQLVKQYLKDEKMVKHCIAVSAIMKHIAIHLGEDSNLWSIIGLLHDIDYDLVNRDPKLHGIKAMEILKDYLPREAVEAIAAHNENNGFKPSSKDAEKIATALRASDHMAGLIVATALVMPNKKISEIKLETLKRKFKSKDFARGVNRDRIRGIENLGIELDKFFEIALKAMNEVAKDLGL